MKDVAVRFESGQEVLNAYWGYLSDGGLVIDHEGPLEIGEDVALAVTIDSSSSRYRFRGRVVKRRSDGRLTVIAFHPGEPHDMLLTEALAEIDDVPARRHRRYRVDLPAEIQNGDAVSVPARLVNLSEEGCCVSLSEDCAARFSAGSAVAITTPTFSAKGRVVWARNTERGVSFGEAACGEAIEQYLRSL